MTAWNEARTTKGRGLAQLGHGAVDCGGLLRIVYCTSTFTLVSFLFFAWCFESYGM